MNIEITDKGRAEYDALVRDAMRYRWLRDTADLMALMILDKAIKRKDWDAAIDAAMGPAIKAINFVAPKKNVLLENDASQFSVYARPRYQSPTDSAPIGSKPAAVPDALEKAIWRLEDMLMGDDGQAWKEAEKALPHLKAALLAARATLTHACAEVVAFGWQDVVTAPRDGMPILMALENGMVRTGRWSATRKYWILAYDGHVRGANSFPITGWMPLPEPPK